MKTSLLGLTLCALTAGAVLLPPLFNDSAAAPAAPAAPGQSAPAPTLPAAQRPRIDVVFALDTTGSMGGLLAAAKEKIWAVASSMAAAQPAPEIRIGLVAFRDRGDTYVTEVVGLTSDLDSLYARLMDFTAEGGGDGPEAVNTALATAVRGMQWRDDALTYRTVFLVGDAPPHRDYQDEEQYPALVAEARRRGIVINTIQCGDDAETARAWQHIASLSTGEFFHVAQNGAAVALGTPYDAELAKLSAALDDTRLYYGNETERARLAAKTAASERVHAEASPATRARRAAFNASPSGAANFLGEQELVSAVSSGTVLLADIAPTALPAPLKALAPAERAALVTQKAAERRELEARIGALTEERDAFLGRAVAAQGGAAESLDQKLFETVRKQGARVGLDYGETPKY